MMKFYEWIKDTIENSPVFIDVYLETSYQYKIFISSSEEGLKESYLGDFIKYFKDCLKKKDNLVCQTSRFHCTDLRDIFETVFKKRIAEIQNRYIYVLVKNYILEILFSREKNHIRFPRV